MLLQDRLCPGQDGSSVSSRYSFAEAMEKSLERFVYTVGTDPAARSYVRYSNYFCPNISA